MARAAHLSFWLYGKTLFDFATGNTPDVPGRPAAGYCLPVARRLFREASLDMTLSILTEAAANICGVERASIWALNDDHRELRCLALFAQRSIRRHSSGNTIDAIGHPAYFRALREGACITVDDKLQPSADRGIHQLLPAAAPHHGRAGNPIHIRGELQGRAVPEQVATRQPWAPAHQIFAQAVANLVALALAEYQAYEAKRQTQMAPRTTARRHQCLPDAPWVADGHSGRILDVNRQAEALTGRSREELLGFGITACSTRRSISKRPATLLRRVAWHAEVRRGDGGGLPVQVTTERTADLSDGGRLALNILRAA